MKILFFSHYFVPEGNAPATRVHAMCREWVRAGHQVTVVTCAPNVPSGRVYEPYQNRWCHEEPIDGIRVVRVWTYLAANKGFARRTLSFLSYFISALWRALLLPKADVVVATSPQFFCGWAGVWAARLKRTAFVLEIRDLWPESIRAVGAAKSRSWWWRGLYRYLEWLERRMYRAAHHIVTVGEGYRQQLEQRGVASYKISVVSNGVDIDRFEPQAPSTVLREQIGAGPRDFVVGYLGTVGMAHGLSVILEAGRLAKAKGFDHLRFVVVGDGAELEWLMNQLHQDDPGNVHFVGRQPKARMPPWLASVDACLVHLRRSELFQSVIPSKMFEAAAMGRPIILGVRGEAEALLGELGAGTAITPESAQELVDVAQTWHQARSVPASYGETARVRVRERFDLQALARRYADLLLLVDDGSHRRSPSLRPTEHRL